jgi:ATP-dependent Clp protease protease subunit
MSPLIPMVIEQTSRGERAFDIYSRCSTSESSSSERPSTTRSPNLIIAQLLHLESEDPDKDVSIYINSPGGSGVPRARDLRHDAVHQARRADDLRRHGDVDGRAAARRRRERKADGAAERQDPDPPGLGRLPGAGDDIEIHARETIALKRRLEEIMSEHTGQEMDKVSKDMERDYFMTPQEAKDYGIIDNVIIHRIPPRTGIRP